MINYINMETKIIHKAYKFRLYPNKEQETLINKSIGSCRFVYNHFLDCKTKFYNEHKLEQKKGLSFVETEHLLVGLKKDENFIWLNEINSQSLQFALRNLDSAYNNFFNKVSDFPTFKKKNGRGSFTIPQFFKVIKEVDEGTKKYCYIKIPKFKQNLKFRLHRKIRGKILFCTVSKTPTNKYFISFTTKEEIEVKENKLLKSVGIDVGIKSFCITSDNVEIQNEKNIKSKERRRKILQRKIAKTVKGGLNRKKLVNRLASKFEKETNIKKDFINKASNYFIESQDIIIAEDLCLKGMIKNHKLAKAISHQSLGEFFRQLEYKSGWNNKVFYKISRWFPSSQICNCCGHQNRNLKLSDRIWICPNCKKEIDRDYNASLNIRDLGMSDLGIPTVGTTESYAFGRVKITNFGKPKLVNSDEKGSPLL